MEQNGAWRIENGAWRNREQGPCFRCVQTRRCFVVSRRVLLLGAGAGAGAATAAVCVLVHTRTA
jgi:hypothetical protein